MVIDAHVHIFPREFIDKRSEYASLDPTFAELYQNPQVRMASANDLMQYMDENGIEKAIVHAIGWGTNRLCHIHNEYMAEMNAKYSSRLITLGSFNPLDQSGAESELLFCQQAGIRGMGEIRADKQGFSLTDFKLLDPFMRFIRKNHMFLSLHCSEPVGHEYTGKGSIWPQDIYFFLRKYPELKVILAHFGGGLCLYGLMPEVKEVLKNSVVDCAAQPYLYDKKVYQTVFEIMGEDSIVFGSDFPLLKLSKYQEQISYLPEKLRRRLLSDNIVKFLS